MWMDADGIAHTVSLPDPSRAMAPETVASLDALSEDERARLVDALDARWEALLASSPEVGAALAPEGAPLPDGSVTGVISCVEDAIDVVDAAEDAWRLDVLLAIQDYVERDA
jgi:hypothetical protein